MPKDERDPMDAYKADVERQENDPENPLNKAEARCWRCNYRIGQWDICPCGLGVPCQEVRKI